MTGISGTMYRFIRFISAIAICLVFILGLNQAQNDETIIIPIILWNDIVLSDTTLENLQEVQEDLTQFDIDIEYDYINFVDLDSDLSISVSLNQELVLDYNSNYLRIVSPALFEEYSLSVHVFDCEICSETEQSSAVKLLTATLLYVFGKHDEAENILVTILHTESTNHVLDKAKFLLGNINIIQGDYEAAEAYYASTTLVREDWLDLAPRLAVNWSWVLLQLGEQIEALGILDQIRAIGLQNGFRAQYLIELLSSRAQIYALAFDYDTAIEGMDEAISIAEENELDNHTLAELYTIRGEIIFLIYEWDRVEVNFTTAIELDPTYAPAYFQRGVLFYTMARREDALADFETYLELDPDGIYAEEASDYIDSIQIEIESLGG